MGDRNSIWDAEVHQLALRTGQYKTINAAEVFEGEIVTLNRFTDAIELNPVAVPLT